MKGNHLIVQNLMHNDQSESFKYEISFDHFQIKQYSNLNLTLIINPVDSLYFENGIEGSHTFSDIESTCFSALKRNIQQRQLNDALYTAEDGNQPIIESGVKKAISMGFYFPT